MEDKMQLVQDYMAILLQAGFSVEEVLKRGISYLAHYAYKNYGMTIETDLHVAQSVMQAAKNLHIDAESQQQAYRRASNSAMPISALEFKQMYEGMIDE